MLVYKFGGASVKDAGGVRNLSAIVRETPGRLIVVVSAMGKTTNLLEDICRNRFNGTESDNDPVGLFREYHRAIARELFPPGSGIFPRMEGWFSVLDEILAAPVSTNYDYEYDRIISLGELLSTTLVSEYLNAQGINNRFRDIRRSLLSDHSYRNAHIDLPLSGPECRKAFSFEETDRYVTQGFIAGTPDGQTTTLGREGSDYTAALLANLLDAESVTIWKDVPGVMNGDPKQYPRAVVIERMSYKEAIELSHFGAKVIHPKTIKPLQNKQIPLYVKSFLYPEVNGSIITDIDERLALPPIFIHKTDQLLLTLTPRDFSFIAEEKLSHIFSVLAKYKLKLNLMQNSAISFSFCIDHHPALFREFLHELQAQYEVLYNEETELITIRHYTEPAIREVIGKRRVLVEQRSRLTAQFILAR